MRQLAVSLRLSLAFRACVSALDQWSIDDNYVWLLPGEIREITWDYEAQAPGETRLAIRGWNVTLKIISASDKK